MKKMFLMFLVAFPLIAGAQTKSAAENPIVLSFNETSVYKKFVVPADSYLRINRICSESEMVNLKISVEANGSACQNKFSQTLTFNRAELERFSEGGVLYLPKYSSIEYDGVPVVIFCVLYRYQ